MHIDLFPSASSLLCLAALGAPQAPPVDQPLYKPEERVAIQAYWNKPNRYQIAVAPDTTGDGLWQVRQTAEGSRWFHTYMRSVSGAGKVNPTIDVRASLSGPQGDWEVWVNAKLAFDRYQATQKMLAANGKIKFGPDIQPVAANMTAAPPAPPAMPDGLRNACGDAPAFLESVLPQQYRVTFDKPDEVFTYTDHVKLRERYAYYRFPQGVVSYGVRLSQMTPAELGRLFRAAGFSPSEQRIFTAVSGLEGGFETVQTYDTGYVSIGFIQFVTLEDGRADLSAVLRQMKADNPKDFQRDFRRFGIDVRADNTLVVVDPESGAELVGKNAVLRVIDDKRLTAVFQRAGRKTPFRVAQIKVARDEYWPSGDPLTVTLADGTVVNTTIGQIVKSEAGLATLLDRKINIGNLSVFPGVAQSVATRYGCRSVDEIHRYEREIVAAMTYRQNFLAGGGLAQPLPPEAFPPLAPVATPTPVVTPSPTITSLPTPTLTPAPGAKGPTKSSPSPKPAMTPTATPATKGTPTVKPTVTPSPTPTATPSAKP